MNYRKPKPEEIKTENGLNFLSGLSLSPHQIDKLLGHVAGVLEETAIEYHVAAREFLMHDEPGTALIESIKTISALKAELKSAFLETSRTLGWHLVPEVPAPSPEAPSPEAPAPRPARRRAKAKAAPATPRDPA
jgi:hypothetical protein